jgi:RNA polymerase sigma factor (sigma-70 family)
MMIRYKFVTGEVLEIEVSGELSAAIESIKHEEDNNDRAETRRHVSLEALLGSGFQLVDEVNIADAVERLMTNEQLYAMLASLRPDQRRLLHRVFVERESLAKIACEEGVKYQSVQDRVQAILKKLKKNF